MDYKNNTNTVLHWNYRGFTEFPLQYLRGEEAEITDIYLKENLISSIPSDIGKLDNLESLYLSGNDITELPREISKLSRLKCLDLSGNRLRCVPDEIGDMRSLKFLILDENELRELPLRIAELRMLRYLSVCGNHVVDKVCVLFVIYLRVSLPDDNKLQWLPQKPVYNYYHCEFRFWRNSNLKYIPYSLWYHMFRGQQTRSLNIGCLSIPKCDNTFYKRSEIGMENDVRKSKMSILFPTKYMKILSKTSVLPPSLLELCKRKLYDAINNIAKKRNAHQNIYSEIIYSEFEPNNNINNLQKNFKDINMNNNELDTRNGNEISSDSYVTKGNEMFSRHCVPSNIVEEYFSYLPRFIKEDLCNGPLSRCENVTCKEPLFDYVYFEFCLERITLIENTEEVVLCAALCSKTCAEKWRIGKSIIYCT